MPANFLDHYINRFYGFCVEDETSAETSESSSTPTSSQVFNQVFNEAPFANSTIQPGTLQELSALPETNVLQEPSITPVGSPDIIPTPTPKETTK